MSRWDQCAIASKCGRDETHSADRVETAHSISHEPFAPGAPKEVFFRQPIHARASLSTEPSLNFSRFQPLTTEQTCHIDWYKPDTRERVQTQDHIAVNLIFASKTAYDRTRTEGTSFEGRE